MPTPTPKPPKLNTQGAALACALAVCFAAAPFAVAQSEVDLPQIVARMTDSLHQSMASQTPYLLLRQYKIFDTDSQDPSRPTAELLAQIQYRPGGPTTYKIEKSTGGMGEWAIRHALDHEVELDRSPQRMEMTERNYTFSFVKMDDLHGHRCYLLESHPRRSDRELLQAQVWVDAQNFHILQIQGHPQKNPSFWVKKLNLTLEFGEMGGIWMHTASRADAEVRFNGPFLILAEALSVQPASGLAQAQIKAHPHPVPRAQATLADAIVSPRPH